MPQRTANNEDTENINKSSWSRNKSDGNSIQINGRVEKLSFPVGDKRFMQDLRTNPEHDKNRIEGEHDIRDPRLYSWILDNHLFTNWHGGATAPLLIEGSQGKGKTMLLCNIINELPNLPGVDSKAPISFFFGEGRSTTDVLRGLIFLLAKQDEALASCLEKMYQQEGKPLYEGWDALSGTLSNMLEQSGSNVYLIIDGLDQLKDGSSPGRLMQFICNSSGDPRLSHVKWLVSCRDRKSLRSQVNTLCLDIEESISAAVDLYIDNMNVPLQALARKTIREKANANFLWVTLVRRELKHEGSPGHLCIQNLLDNTPSKLNHMVKRSEAMRLIDEGYENFERFKKSRGWDKDSLDKASQMYSRAYSIASQRVYPAYTIGKCRAAIVLSDCNRELSYFGRSRSQKLDYLRLAEEYNKEALEGAKETMNSSRIERVNFDAVILLGRRAVVELKGRHVALERLIALRNKYQSSEPRWAEEAHFGVRRLREAIEQNK